MIERSIMQSMGGPMDRAARRRRFLPALLVIGIVVCGIQYGDGLGATWMAFKAGFTEAFHA